MLERDSVGKVLQPKSFNDIYRTKGLRFCHAAGLRETWNCMSTQLST